MSALSDLHADVCRVMPFLRSLKPAPEPDAAEHAAASIESAAMAMENSGLPFASHRAALIRATGDNMSAAMDAMMEWTVARVNGRPA